MEASNTVPAPAVPTLEQVAHTQTDELYDVVALLAAIVDRIEARCSADANDSLLHTLRLAQMARVRVDCVIGAFDPYI